jgi:hypothetical protein
MPGTTAIRAGIAMRAAFAYALSYDALRQMAVAIHIRGLLTYAFPLVLDGFIAIGVGALLMLRTAPLGSRMYVWALVGAATVTSIWANALHAVRLNQQTRQGDSLRLDDLTVGVLSAIAPLALAGAVHLYLVIRRHPTPHVPEADATSRHVHQAGATSSHTYDAGQPDLPPTGGAACDGIADVARDADTAPEAPQSPAEAADREPGTVDEELLAIARTAPLGREGRASRRHIEAKIRGQGNSVGRKDAEAIKYALQAELDQAARRQAEPTTTLAGTR